MDEQTRQLLIEAAILAPSADNSQPWLYRWNNETLELWIDESRSGGFSDQRFVLSDLAIGACIENIVIRAHSFGYDSQIEHLPDPEQTPLWAARIDFSPAPKQYEALAQFIPERHTDRSFFWKGPITTATKQLLSDEAAKTQGVTLIWLDGTPSYKTALKAMWLAESLRFSNKELHQELFSSIRFEVGNRASCTEGLAPATLAIEPPLRPAFKLLRHWPVMKTLNWLSGNYLVGFRSTVLPTLLSPALCLLSIKQTERADIIQAGRSLDRIWLHATALGLKMQPYAAAGVLTLKAGNHTTISNQKRVATIHSLLQEFSEKQHGLLLLRVGRNDKTVRTHSGRRKPESFEITETIG